MLEKNDKIMFYKYLDNATVYFEYGSGGSTYQASKRHNIQKIYSVESDLEWHNKLKEILPNHCIINFIFNEMYTKPKTLEHPGPNSTHDQWKNYSNQFLLLEEYEKKYIDLILIDGRFRVACCLKIFNYISNNCVIAFDDFLNRTYYHTILDYYDIIEKTQDNRMVILKKKNNVSSIDNALIEKYELISS